MNNNIDTNINKIVTNLKDELEQDYSDPAAVLYFPEDFDFNPDDTNQDTKEADKAYITKYIINYLLTPAEKTIFCIYVHQNASYTKLARILNTTPQTARNYIMRVRNKILNYYQIYKNKNI